MYSWPVGPRPRHCDGLQDMFRGFFQESCSSLHPTSDLFDRNEETNQEIKSYDQGSALHETESRELGVPSAMMMRGLPRHGPCNHLSVAYP
jgi:hypothetical protein